MAKKSLAKKDKKKAVKSKKKDPICSVVLNEQIWPMERDLLFRPGRLKYVRKLLKPEGCVFCTSARVAPTASTLCIYKSKFSQIVVNKYPYNSGHLLILPLRHCGDITKLTPEEFLDLNLVLKLAIDAMNSVYEPNGFNLGMNHGATGGAGIPDHLHYHLVPRWNGDLNFFPLIAETKLVIEEVDQTYQKYFEHFRKVK